MRCVGIETCVVHDIPLSKVDLGKIGSNLKSDFCADYAIFGVRQLAKRKGKEITFIVKLQGPYSIRVGVQYYLHKFTSSEQERKEKSVAVVIRN